MLAHAKFFHNYALRTGCVFTQHQTNGECVRATPLFELRVFNSCKFAQLIDWWKVVWLTVLRSINKGLPAIYSDPSLLYFYFMLPLSLVYSLLNFWQDMARCKWKQIEQIPCTVESSQKGVTDKIATTALEYKCTINGQTSWKPCNVLERRWCIVTTLSGIADIDQASLSCHSCQLHLLTYTFQGCVLVPRYHQLIALRCLRCCSVARAYRLVVAGNLHLDRVLNLKLTSYL